MSDDFTITDVGVTKPPITLPTKGRNKKKQTIQTELEPMVTHWKPTGHHCYRVDMKPTVIRRRSSEPAPPPRPSPPLLRKVGVADLLPPVSRPKAVPLRSTSASPRELQAWSTTSNRKSDMWRPKSRSLETPDSAEMVRHLRQQRYVCAACSEGRCCQTRGFSVCVPECPCALVLAWQELEISSPPTPRREVYTPDPRYVRAWSDVPRKCDPQAWVSVRRKPKSRVDQEGANFRWMGWNFVPDFTTVQSCYG